MKILKRKQGSTFRRLVLLDESVFEQLKQGTVTTPASAARAYIKDRMTGQLQSATLSDRDRVNMHREMRATLEQLDKPIAQPAQVPEHTAEEVALPVQHGNPAMLPGTSQDADEDDDSEYMDAAAGEKTVANLSSTSTVLPPPLAAPKAKKLPNVQVPAQYQRKYEAIDELLEQSGAVHVDHSGQLTLNNELIEGSDYSKIIKSFFVKSNEGERYTKGRSRLLCWLAAVGVPTSAVSVESAKDVMQRWLDTQVRDGATSSKIPKQVGKGVPPGRRPKVLCMYKL